MGAIWDNPCPKPRPCGLGVGWEWSGAGWALAVEGVVVAGEGGEHAASN